MSPYEMLILFSLNASTQSVLPHCMDEITHRAVKSLLKIGMIEHSTATVSGYELTDRARVYIAAVTAVPLPVRSTAPWVMPEREPAKPQTQYGSRER